MKSRRVEEGKQWRYIKHETSLITKIDKTGGKKRREKQEAKCTQKDENRSGTKEFVKKGEKIDSN